MQNAIMQVNNAHIKKRTQINVHKAHNIVWAISGNCKPSETPVKVVPADDEVFIRCFLNFIPTFGRVKSTARIKKTKPYKKQAVHSITPE